MGRRRATPATLTQLNFKGTGNPGAFLHFLEDECEAGLTPPR
jgi:hypothetical protein